MSNRFHNKWHRASHHTYKDPTIIDAGWDPIASPNSPFQGDFVLADGSGGTHIGELYSKIIHTTELTPESPEGQDWNADKILVDTNLEVTKNITGDVDLYVKRNTSGHGWLKIDSYGDFGGYLHSVGNISGDSQLFITGDGTFGGNVNITGNETVKGNFNLTGNANINGIISGHSWLKIDQYGHFVGDVSGDSNLYVTGYGHIGEYVHIYGDDETAGTYGLIVDKNSHFVGSADIDSNLNVDGKTVLNDQLDVLGTNNNNISGNIRLKGNLSADDYIRTTNNLDVSGDGHIVQNLQVDGYVHITGDPSDTDGHALVVPDLYVTQHLSAVSATFHNIDITASEGRGFVVTGYAPGETVPVDYFEVPTTSFIHGYKNVYLDKVGLFVDGWTVLSGDTLLHRKLNVSGDSTLSTLNVTGDSDLDGNLDVGGILTVTGTTTLNSTLNVSGETALKNTSIDGTLGVTGAVDFDSTLNVDGATTLNGGVTVKTSPSNKSMIFDGEKIYRKNGTQSAGTFLFPSYGGTLVARPNSPLPPSGNIPMFNEYGNIVDSGNDATDFYPMVEKEWAQLKAMRDEGTLVPGQQYRITDYVATTTKEDTQTANHRFDIIVRADATDKLNENAYATMHEKVAEFSNTESYSVGDYVIYSGNVYKCTIAHTGAWNGSDFSVEKPYFYDSKLEAWKVWYCLDNDTNRFAWADNTVAYFILSFDGGRWDRHSAGDVPGADHPYCWVESGYSNYGYTNTATPTGYSPSSVSDSVMYTHPNGNDGALAIREVFSAGKGVIYRLIDEFGNDCPYDFKGITMKAYGDTDNVYRYTFDSGDASNNTDYSLSGGTRNVYNNVIGKYLVSNKPRLNQIIFKGIGCHSNTFGNNCYSNTFGNNCYSNTFENECYGNTFGNNCYSNMFGNDCYYNTFGDNCFENTFGEYCYSNMFGIGYHSNTFGEYCYSNMFGNDCYSNTFGNNCYSNTFGEYCYSNTFENECYGNTFGDGCFENTFGNKCYSNTFGDNCFENTFGEYCYSNTFENDCYSNTFGNDCYSNTFGNDCYSNTFRKDCTLNTFGNNCYSNTFENECRFNTFGEFCYSNTFGNNCTYNRFGNDCYSNTFRNDCTFNTFGNDCCSNTFGFNCATNTFGEFCCSNTFGFNCATNTFGEYCYSNTFGDGCYDNTFGDNCGSNTFGHECYENTFGDFCAYNTFGCDCFSDTFGNNCTYNTFGNNCSSNTFGGNVVKHFDAELSYFNGDYVKRENKYWCCVVSYTGLFSTSKSYVVDDYLWRSYKYYRCITAHQGAWNGDHFVEVQFSNMFTEVYISDIFASYYSFITFEDGNCNILLDCTGSISQSTPYQNVTIAKGVNGVASNQTKHIEDSNVNQAFKTVYQPVNSKIISI